MTKNIRKKAKVDPEAVWELYDGFLNSINEDNPEGDVDFLFELVKLVDESLGGASKQPIDAAWWENEQNRLAVLSSAAHCTLSEYFMTLGMNEIDEAASWKACVAHLRAAIHFFGKNANAWSLLANHGRTMGVFTLDWYEKAVESVQQVRQAAITLLEAPETPYKDLIELLLLNHAIGVEALDNEDEDEESPRSIDDKSSQTLSEWSPSAVEATARFMAAMGHSTRGDHSQALTHLQHLNVSHRLHVNVWGHKMCDRIDDKVIAYDNVLPDAEYRQMCQVFAPNAHYWKESDYESRGYFSFFQRRDQIGVQCNLIEAVIHMYLYPLAKEHADQDIIGYEWWVHHRATTQSLGHNIHFDTDEAMLAHVRQVTHPVYSSVLYLTGGNQGGTTVIMDQTPDSPSNAEWAHLSIPRDNRFVLFPGNRLHGVLPCRGAAQAPSCNKLDDLPVPDASSTSEHRLTFMVGFWARDVQAKMTTRRLYCPCGFVPEDESVQWVQEIKDYQPSSSNKTTAIPESVTVPIVGPVWEEIDRADGNTPLLEIPKALDHRFFVKNAPHCFRDSLFERNEFYDTEEDETEA